MDSRLELITHPGRDPGASRAARLPMVAWASTVALLAILGRPATSGEVSPSPAFVLPEKLDNYARPELPAHFRTAFVRRLDNTPTDNPITDEGATLGRVLFHDRRFSSDGTISCASCHSQANAFSDPERFSKGVGGRLGDRNAMGLINLRYIQNGKFFWDERAPSPEAQVLLPIEDRREMAHDLNRVVRTIRADPAYAPLFRRAFGDEDGTRDRVARALAQFVRSIVSYRSRFDDGLAKVRSINQDFPNFTGSENLGKKIFLGDHDEASRGNCATCHLRNYAFFRPNDGNRSAQQALFLPDRLFNNGLDAEYVNEDNGVGDLTLDPGDYGLFRAPDLRNVELTAPYIHDGRFKTLEEVVEHYSTGVKRHPNLDPQLLGGGPGRGRNGPHLMNLDGDEKAALVAFLKTRTDRKLVTDPRSSDPFRK